VCSSELAAMTIHYNAGEMNELSVLFKWRGTIMPMVLGRPVIWLLIALHCGLLYVHRRREDIELPKLPWKVVAVPQALLTFFVVFFSGSCYSRYYTLYTKCTGVAGALMCWVGLLRVFFNDASPEQLWNLSRHAIASVYVHYFTLAGSASGGGKLMTETEWSVVMARRMLSAEERRVVDSYQGFKPFLLQEWALQTVNEYLATDAKRTVGAGIAPFMAQALALRKNCAETVNLLAQPVPFPYFHVINFMLSVNLVLVAYSLTFIDSIMTVPLFFIVCLVLQGLKECAVALADPFGGDAVDFDVDLFLANILSNARALIAKDAAFQPGTHMPCPPLGKEELSGDPSGPAPY
jgi:predicted membrane chloride channel (bestrophin family)